MDLTGAYTADYLTETRDTFKRIESINYYIHDEITLIDPSTLTYSWDHWDGHEMFISDLFDDIDKYIDLDFRRTYDSRDAHIEIYRVSPNSPYVRDGLLGIALDSESAAALTSLPIPDKKDFGIYQLALWANKEVNNSPFIRDYDVLRYSDAHTIIHEVGHVLGLSHPQNNGIDDPFGEWHDDRDSVMSYNDYPRYDKYGIFSNPLTWSVADRQTLVEIWGQEDDTLVPDAGDPESPKTPSNPALSLNSTTMQLLYVAYYGRPGDVGGLQFWQSKIAESGFSYAPRLGDGLSETERPLYDRIVVDFGDSIESQQLYAGKTRQDSADTVYQYCFGRDAEIDPLTGENYWVGKLDRNEITLSQLAAEVALGAQGPDLTFMNNRIEAANLFFNAMDTPAEQLGYSGPNDDAMARNWLLQFGFTRATSAMADDIMETIVATI